MKKMMFAAAVAALFCSCAKEETTVNPAEGKLVYRELTADIAPMGRAHLGEVETEGKIGVWLDKGDLVLFVNEEGTAATVAVDRTENGKVYFAGEMPTGTLKACYPAWAYDNDKRNYWDISQTNSTYGTLNVDKHQFAHEAVGKMDHLVNNNANKNDEWRANSIPVAMTGAVATDADHFTFTADTNAAILEIPVTGDVLLQNICLYYTDKILETNGGSKTDCTYKLLFINEQLTSEAKKFYIMVTPGTAKYITLEFQTSTEPQSAIDLNTLNGTQTPGKDELDWYNGRCYGFRYMRRASNKTTYAVSGITTLPATDLTAANLDANRYVLHFGSAHQAKNYGIKEGYPTVADFKGLTNGNVVTQHENYVEVEIKQNGGTLAVGNDCSWRGDYGISSNTGNPASDKAVMPIDAGNYRYCAIKTDMRVITQNKTDYWTSTGTKGNLQFYVGYEYIDGSKVYFEKWSNRECKDTSAFSYVNTDEDGVEVLVFDLMSRWKAWDNWLPTTRKIDAHAFKFVVADMKRTMTEADFDADGKCTFENPKYKVYWIGFFTSVDEISTFMRNN